VKRWNKPRAATALIVAAMAVVAGCSPNDPPEPSQQERLCSKTDAQLAAERGYDTATVNFAMANGYYGWCIPEYDDDQRLSDGNLSGKDYGPVAHVLAAPWLDTLQFNTTFRQVAILALDAEAVPSPGSYAQLGLGQFNCIYLRHPAAADTGFDALIVPPTSGKCAAAPASSASTLAVSVEQPAGEDPHDYPPTTRFIEAGDGRTLIGVRCGNHWCAIGTHLGGGRGSATGPAAAGIIPASAHSGVGGFKYAQATVKGWFDDQVLGIPDALGKHHIRRQIRASAIPDPKLGHLTMDNFIHPTGSDPYQTVGRTYFPDSVPGTSKYFKVFGFRQGVNLVAMRAEVHAPNGLQPDTVWFTRVINAQGDTTINIPTRRMDHNKYFSSVYGDHASIPPTMRWRWSDKDEDLWSECVGGCCLAGQ